MALKCNPHIRPRPSSDARSLRSSVSPSLSLSPPGPMVTLMPTTERLVDEIDISPSQFVIENKENIYKSYTFQEKIGEGGRSG